MQMHDHNFSCCQLNMCGYTQRGHQLLSSPWDKEHGHDRLAHIVLKHIKSRQEPKQLSVAQPPE